MKLLLDQNLSPRLVTSLHEQYPGSVHVREFGLERADDLVIWAFARERGYSILSKDADFHQLSFLHGHPPKVLWLQFGNCTTDEILDLILHRRNEIAAFSADKEASFLALH